MTDLKKKKKVYNLFKSKDLEFEWCWAKSLSYQPIMELTKFEATEFYKKLWAQQGQRTFTTFRCPSCSSSENLTMTKRLGSWSTSFFMFLRYDLSCMSPRTFFFNQKRLILSLNCYSLC